jgi:hypothetical protein
MTRFAAAMKKPPDGGGVVRLGSDIAPASAPGPARSALATDGGASVKFLLSLHSVKQWGQTCHGLDNTPPKRTKAVNSSLDCIIPSFQRFIPFSIPALLPGFKPAAVLKGSQEPFLIRLSGAGG